VFDKKCIITINYLPEDSLFMIIQSVITNQLYGAESL